MILELGRTWYMNNNFKIVLFSMILFATSFGGLYANEAFNVFSAFCKTDQRFSDHLAPHHDLPVRKYGLRHSVFLHNVILINFFNRNFNVGISIVTMEPPIKHKTHIGVAEFQNEEKIADLIILVNPEEDFVSAFFSIQRELILGRKFLERIRGGDIDIQTSLEEFEEYFKTDYKLTLESINKDFDMHIKEWITSEGLFEEANKWIKNEIKNITKSDDETPADVKKQLKNQIEILYEIIPQIVY
jgi:hypothetical protein